MSILAQQLNRLKLSNSISIAPGAPKATLILDKQTARNTTSDVLYTMAVLGYGEIKKSIAHGARAVGEELLSEDKIEFNRNRLTKDENKTLSGKLTSFLLMISPYFLNRGCQAIIEYLIRNYSIHIFEAEPLVLIFLQYWQHDSYSKLISNIEIKNQNLQFIKNIQENKQINLTYIIKSLTYSRSLLQSLIMLTQKYIKEQSRQTEEIQIQLTHLQTNAVLKVQTSTVIKRDLKQFLLQILCLLIHRKISAFNKQIVDFCLFASRQQQQQTYSLSMILSVSLLSSENSQSQWIKKIITNLLSKSQQISQSIFNFIMIIWQRWPALITHETISILLQKQHFVLRLTQFQKSIHIVFYTLFEYLVHPKLENKGIVLQILQAICLKVKEEQFVQAHQTAFFAQIFSIIQENYDNLATKQQKGIIKFVQNSLLYELAVYISSFKASRLINIIPNNHLNANNSINFDTISKVRQQIKQDIKQKEMIEEQQEVSEQEKEEYQVENSQNSKILKVFNSWSKSQIKQLNLANPQVFNLAVSLLKKYYSGKSSTQKLNLNSFQKNRLLQNAELFKDYTIQNFNFDFSNKDYNTCIRYLLSNGTIEICYKVLQKACEDPEFADDLLYRELSRQAIQKLSKIAEVSYKNVMNALGKLYHSYCKNCKPENLKFLNELMLKMSETVFARIGQQKGKFFKLIASHSRILAKLSLSPVYRQNYSLETYNRLLTIFGNNNTYCFLIGAAQMLAVKDSNKKMFIHFIDRVIVPSLHFSDLKDDKQAAQFKNVLKLFQSLNKCLSFCHFMVEQVTTNKVQEEEKQSLFEPGVAKKMISGFFGLCNIKSRKAIVRKIMLFISKITKSSSIQSIIDQSLSVITRKQQLKFTSIISKIYKKLVSLQNLSIGPMFQVASLAKQNTLKLFPLQLKIDVLGPLLPLDEVYAQLANDLRSHPTFKSDNLRYFINIIPNNLTDPWCEFAFECIKRGYLPTTQNCKEILSLSSKNTTNAIKFICYMSEFAREQCLLILQEMMEIVFKECSQRNDYSLAILYTIVKNLKQLSGPHLNKIFENGIEVASPNTNKFVDSISESFTAPTLIGLAKTFYKTVQNSANFSYFLLKISERVSFETIWKTTQNFFSRSLNVLVQNQESFKELHEKQAQIFINQALKMNENELRKIIIDYIRWSSQKTNTDSLQNMHFNSRKHLLYIIFQKLCGKLDQLFIHFYGYIWSDIIQDLQNLSIMQQSSSPAQKSGKRNRQLTPYSIQCTSEYAVQLLKMLKIMIQKDTQNQFMDAIKFDALAIPICSVFNLTRFGQYYDEVVNVNLKQCLLSLFEFTKDDYKLKTINTEILKLLRTKDNRITTAIYGFYNELIDVIQHRFLIFADEITPLLIESTMNRNIAIKKVVEQIIYKLQNLSGQKIGKKVNK